MLSKVVVIKESTEVDSELSQLLSRLHTEGPISASILETLSLYKEFHPQYFSALEEQFISALGLFYKNVNPSNLYSLLLSTIGAAHKEKYGALLTPVQANVRQAVNDHQFVSISAPTSAGKSYSIRDFIYDQLGDAVIVVPSRALIAEYVSALRRRFGDRKDVMVSSFVDKVFKSRDLRRIFVLTPERARELFNMRERLSVGIFFFDEAQVSEERGRGIVFDVLVRRVQKLFPTAKLIFAHPFVDNPEAQFSKHAIRTGYAKAYPQGSVGKICIFGHANGNDYYFSPFQEKGHTLAQCVEFNGSFHDFAFDGNHSILVYVSKASIYNGKFLNGFEEHVAKFSSVSDSSATRLIDDIEKILGADENEHKSRLVSLLKKGVVIHHGSVPLDVRFLLEDFIRAGFARMCFATSTLAQGVNMPFDIVWLQSNRIIGGDDDDRALSFKNLVGRAGRLSDLRKFDFGYVYTENPKLLIERINGTYSLSEVSVIDQDFETDTTDTRELRESIRNGTFDDDLNMPISRAERLASPDIQQACGNVLNIIYDDGTIRENITGNAKKLARESIRASLRHIFVTSINRELIDGEASVFNTAIYIFLLAICGRTFKEIAGIRFSEISKRDKGRTGNAEFAQSAEPLPNNKLVRAFPLFKNGTTAQEVSYDAVVFDTYDYMDQVISFSLADVFFSAFKIYHKRTSDNRAEKMLELLRYGTNDVIHVLLMRYGFSPETISEISPFIRFVNEDQIIFDDEIYSAPDHVKKMIEWYLPQ